MKRLSLALVVVLLAVVCLRIGDTPPVITSIVSVNSGSDLDISWLPTGTTPDYYIVRIYGPAGVYFADTFNFDITNYTADSSLRGKFVQVVGMYVHGESPDDPVNIFTATTDDVRAWSTDDTLSNPSYLEFDMANGVVQATSDSLKAHVQVGGALPGGPFYLLSNVANNPSWEARFVAGDTSFATSDFAPHPSLFGAGATIVAGDLFYCWLDTDPKGSWNADDYFAKVEVTALDTLTGKVTMKWGVQSAVPGLRWLVD